MYQRRTFTIVLLILCVAIE